MIEPLESRTAPAGLIFVSFHDGTLVLKAEGFLDGDEAATISQLAGKTRIIPGATTELRFNGLTTAGGIPLEIDDTASRISAHLGEGNDHLTINGGTWAALSLDLGTGPGGTLELNALIVTGTTRIRSGGEAAQVDQIYLRGGTFGKVDISPGSGTNFTELHGITTGALIYTGGGGADDLRLLGTNFTTTSLDVKLGAGGDRFTASAGDLKINGSARIHAGSGNDVVLFQNGALTALATLSVATGTGSDTVTFASTLSVLDVAKHLTITSSGSRSARIEQDVSAARVETGGSVKMTAGTGDRVTQTFGAGVHNIAGGLAMKASNPTDHFQNFFGSRDAALGVAEGVSMSSRGINVTQNLSAVTDIAGPLSLRGGTTVIAALTGHADSAHIATASGRAATVTVTAGIVDGAFRIATGEGFLAASTITLRGIEAAGTLTISGGTGATTLRMDELTVRGDFTARLGDGANQFLVEQSGSTGTTVFHSSAEFHGGADADGFTIAKTGVDAVEFKSTALLHGHAGSDTATLGDGITLPAGGSVVKKSIEA